MATGTVDRSAARSTAAINSSKSQDDGGAQTLCSRHDARDEVQADDIESTYGITMLMRVVKHVGNVD